MTSWVPSTSSKNRSITTRSWVGSVPRAATTGRQVGDDLVGDLVADPGRSRTRSRAAVLAAVGEAALDRGAERAHLGRELRRPGRRLAEPERDGRRELAGVVHPHGADLDLLHPPRVGAEQEDVADGGLDREVLVHRADRDPVGIEHDPVVAGLGDGARRS